MEKERLDKKGINTDDHVVTIGYLKTGEHAYGTSSIDEFPLLNSAINDYDTLRSDYLGV